MKVSIDTSVKPENVAQANQAQYAAQNGKVLITLGDTGIIKAVPTGFSWTSFFFGALVPMVRGDLVVAIIAVLACVATGGIAAPFVWIYLACAYNERYLLSMLEKGWTIIKPAEKE
jgi:hypothetical protein